MDQPICGHLNDHSSVACVTIVQTSEGCPTYLQDRPQICNVPGKMLAINTHTHTHRIQP